MYKFSLQNCTRKDVNTLMFFKYQRTADAQLGKGTDKIVSQWGGIHTVYIDNARSTQTGELGSEVTISMRERYLLIRILYQIKEINFWQSRNISPSCKFL